jgi:alkylation response protein AidB-like acyl-CoA dehydrogenase
MAETPEELRGRYRAWLEANVPRDWRARCEDDEQALAVQRAWVKTLRSGGWAAPHWPVEFGGLGADLAKQVVIHEEITRADAPTPTMFAMAFVHAAMTLIHAGTDAQRAQHLGRILEGDEVWCQCFSEPNAGSDLASLTTRAELDATAGSYVLNGQKIWSSGAHRADWAMVLARTSSEGPKQAGITYFLVDLRLPGVEVRQIRSILGSEEFCEVFFTDARVPIENRLGNEGDGWKIAQSTLTTERSLLLLPVVNALHEQVRALVDLLPAFEARERHHFEPVVARDLAEVEILRELMYKVLTKAALGGSGPEASILKLCYAELSQRVTQHGLDMAGLSAQEMWAPTFDNNSAQFDGAWGRAHYWSWAWTISGGSNEIQRNIIAERVLGLPKEPAGRVVAR